MPSYSNGEVVLVRYPFSDLSDSKVRPAVVVNAPHSSKDLMIVPITSRLDSLLLGEFQISERIKAGLNVPSAVKRGIFTIDQALVIKRVGTLDTADMTQLKATLRVWLGL